VRCLCVASFAAVTLIGATAAVGQQPLAIQIGGATLHYVEAGKGAPVILMHGGQGDYRAWQAHMPALSQQYRVIAYSRRHHFPNTNPITGNYSARQDAEDLGGFMAALKLGPAHLIGTSYGALGALIFALEHPAQVRSLVLAEPPVLEWANDLPGGRELYTHFMDNVHRQAQKLFAAGREEDALRILIDEFDGAGSFDRLPPERREVVMQNAGFFRAVTASAEPFPNLDRARVRRLPRPLLVVRGQHTDALHRMVSEHLASLVPQAKSVVIPDAGHGSPRQNPRIFTEAVQTFLAGVSRP
jgi:pimeloyl-ACP methyl ester carboxylesterase